MRPWSGYQAADVPVVALLRSQVVNASEEISPSILGKGQPASRVVLSMIAIALVASIALNVLLAHRVRSLTFARSARMAEFRLNVGATVPPIAAKRLDGQQDTISYENTREPTVLYVFTPACSWCARNIDNFKKLVLKERGQFRIVGISLSQERLSEYVEKNGLNIPIYVGLSEETKRAYKLGSTPQTIVISPEGKVLQDWAGAYVGDQKSQVEAFFHVSLPGLRDLPKAQAPKN